MTNVNGDLDTTGVYGIEDEIQCEACDDFGWDCKACWGGADTVTVDAA